MNTLPGKWSDFLRTQAETGMGYRVVAITLQDGRKFENVAIVESNVIGEVRGYSALPFDPADIASIELTHHKWQFKR
jgi:hypothetical protein